MLNIRGDNPTQFNDALDAFTEELAAKCARAAAEVKAAYGVSALTEAGATQVPDQQPAQQQQQSQPQGGGWGGQQNQQQSQPQNNAGGPQNGQPHPEGKSCPQCNSTLVWKQFNRKSDQKLLKMWTCPNGRSQGDGHLSEFVW